MNGYTVSSSFEHDLPSGFSTNLDNFAVDTTRHVVASSPVAGSFSAVLHRLYGQQAFVGEKVTSFVDQFYNTIWVIPQLTEVGNLTAEVVVGVLVWNAYFFANDLEMVETVGDATGLTLSGFASGTFNPLEAKNYTITATLNGPPNFDVLYKWIFDTDINSTRVTGRRVVPFVLRHNWETAVNEQLACKTDVLTAISGYEQRRGLRAIPRRRVEMVYLSMTANERATLENQLYGWQSRTFLVPLWSDQSPLTADAPVGSVNFSLDTRYRDFDVHGYIFITDGENVDTLQVDTITAGSITTKTASLFAYGAGAKVAPARFGSPESKIDAARITSIADAPRMAWLIDADQASINRRKAYTPVTYRGLEVYEKSNDYSNQIAVTQELDETILDNDLGVRDRDSGEPYPRRTYPFRNLMLRDEFAEFLDWFYTREGRLNPFWYNERVPAFEITQDVLFNSTTMRVRNVGYSTLIATATPRRDIAIKNGSTWIYRRINGAVDNQDGTETISLDAAPGVTLLAADEPLISYLKCVRLAQDSVDLSFETSGIVRGATSFIDLLTN
jgi:hypothetical protein